VKVYLDYAATSPIKPEVRKAIAPFLNEDFGNPSSIHSWGRKARAAVDIARAQVAKFLGAKESEIIFTSGGTEADNLVLRGMINYQLSIYNNQKPHIITSMIEHHAILKTCENLEKTGMAEVTYLKPNREGIIGVQQIKRALKKNTVLVSIGYVNNEIGTIAPIREIGKMIEKINKFRILNSELKNSKIYFHTDAVQAAEYFPMNVDFLHVDMLTISGHKIGAPKGIGVLYIRQKTPIGKIIFGGEQEMNLRAGTENVVGMVALGKAIELIQNSKFRIKKLIKLRDYFIKKVLKEIPEVELNGSQELRSPNNVNFYFKYIEGESILLNLDLVGIAASSGSACTSQSLEPSHVLLAVFGNPERAHGSIRFTLGKNSTKEEIDYTIQNLKKIVKKLRAMSPLYKGK
jgi:cysteine desulfurase